MTNQPKWKLLANLGDMNPIDYGGFFVYEDTTGVYTAQGELLEVLNNGEDEDGVEIEWIVYRFILEPCTYVNGILSDNEYHPEHPAWFAKPESEQTTRPQDSTYLSNVTRSCGQSIEELVKQFCSEDPLERAHAYRVVGEYHGFDNFDHYPLILTTRAEVEDYYK